MRAGTERFRKRSKTAGDTHGRGAHGTNDTGAVVPRGMQRGRLQPASEGATRIDARAHGHVNAEKKRRGRTAKAGERRPRGGRPLDVGATRTRRRERVTGGRERCAPPLRMYARADDSCVSLSAASCASCAHERQSGRRNKDGGCRGVEKDRRRAGG